MNSRRFKIISIPTLAILSLCACVSNFAVYEPPTSGVLSNITFVNSAISQKARLATFDEGITCTRRRHIQFAKEDGIPAGKSRSLVLAAGKEFALFASLDAIESDEYEVEIGMTGGGPGPLRKRNVLAIGCNARLSFEVEPGKDYHVLITEPESSESCSVVVSETNEEGELTAVRTTQRTSRSPGDELGSFCEPL